LVEALVVLTIAGLLATWAAPWLQGWVLQHRLATATNALVAAFALARQTAMTLQRPVALCAGAPPRCHDPAGWDWAKGWLMFFDDNRNGSIDAGEPLLHTAAAAPEGVAVFANSPLRKPVVFTPLGVAQQAGGAFSAGRIRLCVRSPIRNNVHDLVLAKSGRVRLEESDFGGNCPAP
jgi:type IV fimbrial biogenesis protein FimT